MNQPADSLDQDSARPPSAVVFAEAVWFWLKLGCISFGGPAGQIAIMHQELVERRRWISEQRFLHALNYCMLLPGPEAQQLATYMGWLLHRTWGGIAAGVLFVLPSLLLLIALSWLYSSYGGVAWVAAIFYGIKPAVAALVVQAAHRMGARVLKNPPLWAIAVAAFVAIFALQLPFPYIVLAAAGIGYWGGRLLPDAFSASPGHTQAASSTGAAVIDDHTPTPAHAHFRLGRFTRVLLLGVLLWALPLGTLWVYFGWQHTLTQMAWFFTKAALLTFGGAYAVLPYVYQGAVVHYGWLSPRQMIDGLALGESTPGPLIMVVAFVAFVGAYGQALFGPEQRFAAGALAAVLVTWFTFLPSFIFIFAGAPFIETTRKRLAFTAPLTAITAAVVGVILNLALFMVYHIVWPEGFTGRFDGLSALVAVAAAVALMRYKINLLAVLGAAGLAGLLAWLLGVPVPLGGNG
jgi:chromate transporter